MGTIGGGEPFTIQGFLFQSNALVQLIVDGRATAQLRTDANGRFTTQVIAPSMFGLHEIVAQQGTGTQPARVAIRFGVKNYDEKGQAVDRKKDSVDEKKEDSKVVAPPSAMFPILITATDLAGAATARGGEIRFEGSLSIPHTFSAIHCSFNWRSVAYGNRCPIPGSASSDPAVQACCDAPRSGPADTGAPPGGLPPPKPFPVPIPSRPPE